MDKDKSLQKGKKMVLLICGDPKTGKKSIVNSWLKNIEYKENAHSFFKDYSFSFETTIDDVKVSIPTEIRILNSDEIETELKINATFFKEALGGFIITAIDDENSFLNGEKWKEKLDLMCCLPNKFPLPIFLIINKCDLYNSENPEKPFQEPSKIEQYYLENQFFNKNLITCEENIENIENKKNINETIQPLTDMIKTIMNFRDIKEEFVKTTHPTNQNQNLNKNQKKDCNIF